MSDANTQNTTAFFAGPEGATDDDNVANDTGGGSLWISKDHIIAKRYDSVAFGYGAESRIKICKRDMTSYLGQHLFFDNIRNKLVSGAEVPATYWAGLMARVAAAGNFAADNATDAHLVWHELANAVSRLPKGERTLGEDDWIATLASEGLEDDAIKDVEEARWSSKITIGMLDEQGEPGRGLSQFVGTCDFARTLEEMISTDHLSYLSTIYSEVKVGEYRMEGADAKTQARMVGNFFRRTACPTGLWTPPHDIEAAHREISRRTLSAAECLHERLALVRLRNLPILRQLFVAPESGAQIRSYVLRLTIAYSPTATCSAELIAAMEAAVAKVMNTIPQDVIDGSNEEVCAWAETALRTNVVGSGYNQTSSDTNGHKSNNEPVDLDAFARKNATFLAIIAALHRDNADAKAIATAMMLDPKGLTLLVSSKKNLQLDGFKQL